MNPADTSEVKRIIAESRKGFPLWAKESIGFAIVMAGAVWIIQTHIPAQIGSQTSSMAADVAVLKSDIGSIKTDVSEIRKDIKDQLIKALDAARQELQKGPASSKHSAVHLGNSVLDTAKAFKVRLGVEPLNRYGQALISVSYVPELRQATQIGMNLALDLRSFTNVDFVPPHAKLSDTDLIFDYALPGPKSGDSRWGGNWVPVEEGANAGQIGRPKLSEVRGQNTGPQYLVVSNAIANLDGWDLKQVIYEDSQISYHGNPLKMTKVYFVNCTFDVTPTIRTEQFSRTLLASVPVTISIK